MARAVIDQLPHESVLYLGDTARQPYGPKPIGEVREYALECLDHLVDQGVKALVIACNSASAAVLRDARERYQVPVVEVILPATRRAVAATPHRPDRRDLHPRDRRVDGLRRRVHRRPARRAAHPGLPAVRRVRRGRRHRRPGAAGGRPRVPRPADLGRHRHPDPRLHPLPAADRRRVLRDGRPGDPGVQRRGVRQGRLPAARPARPRARRGAAAARAPVPHHRPARGVRARSAAGSSAPSCESVAPARRGHVVGPADGRGDEAHRRRLLRLLRRPGLGRQLLPARGASTTAAPGGCCSTSAAARSGRCSGSSTR